MKKTIKRKYIEEEEISDLDLMLVDNIFGNNPNGHDYGVISNRGFDFSGEADEIEIDSLIKTLEDLKKKGANYVEIVPHIDHHGYVLTSLEIRKATKEEIIAEKEKQNRGKALAKKVEIERMEKALEKLKK